MLRTAMLIVPLIVALAAIFEVAVVADPSTGGGAPESGDQAYGKPPSTVADATSRDSAGRRVVVGRSFSSIDTAQSNSGSVVSGGEAANGRDSDLLTSAPTECSASNGETRNEAANGGKAVTTGIKVTAIGGNATAACYASGGDAVVIVSSTDISSLINNSSGGDFWAFLRTLVSQFYSNVPTGSRDGSAAVRSSCGSRAVGGSAVFRAGNGGRAVGGSATILGVVGGKLQVFRHAYGEISNVSGSVASGGVVTFP